MGVGTSRDVGTPGDRDRAGTCIHLGTRVRLGMWMRLGTWLLLGMRLHLQCYKFFIRANFCKNPGGFLAKIRAKSRQNKNFVILSGFLFRAHSERYFADWRTAQYCSEHALNHQNPGKITNTRAISPKCPDIRARPDLSGRLINTASGDVGMSGDMGTSGDVDTSGDVLGGGYV